MRILERNEFVYKHMGKSPKVTKASPPKRWFECFCVHTQNFHCNLSETSLEFTSRVEFEFVIVISIRDANLRTHMLKIRH